MRSMLRSALSSFWTWRLKHIAQTIGEGCHANGRVSAKNLHLGDDCHFNGMRVYGSGQVEIGSHFHSASGLEILTEFHDHQGTALPYDEGVIVKNVSIGPYVWVGKDVCILGGVTIGEGAIIQARSVVVKDIPPLAIAGGHPAAAFRYRDEEHYRRLARAK